MLSEDAILQDVVFLETLHLIINTEVEDGVL